MNESSSHPHHFTTGKNACQKTPENDEVSQSARAEPHVNRPQSDSSEAGEQTRKADPTPNCFTLDEQQDDD